MSTMKRSAKMTLLSYVVTLPRLMPFSEMAPTSKAAAARGGAVWGWGGLGKGIGVARGLEGGRSGRCCQLLQAGGCNSSFLPPLPGPK